MAPFLVDPVSISTRSTKRKHRTSYHTHHRNPRINTTVALAIVGGIAALLIIILIVGLIQRRRKAKGKGLSGSGDDGVTRGYSADANSGLHGGSPGEYAGGWTEQEGKDSMSGNKSDDDSASDYSTSGGGGHHGGGTAAVQGEAAAYYSSSQGYGYGGYSQNPYQGQGHMYGGPESHEEPRQPSRALIPPRVHASFI